METEARPTVLVTGGSVAGPAVAYWLDQAGYDVTVLERADAPRRAGQNIDVRGRGRDVVERMGLLERVRAANTGERGTRFVDENGKTVTEFPADGEEDGPTAELEVLRGELSDLLRDACPDVVTFRYGDQVVALTQDGEHVSVELAGGDTLDVDLLVVAEGAMSSTRDLVFTGDQAPERQRLGMYTAYGTIARTDEDDAWWRWLNLPGERSVSLRPDNEGTTRTMVSFLSEPLGLEDAGRDAQMAEIRRRFDDPVWELPRIVEGLESTDEYYFEDVTQVKAPVWRDGRVVLLGDAAWCVTPVGGAGTSLALIGAYVLAAMLSQHRDDPSAALEAYEEWMRPLVDDAQHLPPGGPRMMHPKTAAGAGVVRTVLKVAGSRPVRGLVEKLTPSPADDQELPAFSESA